VANKKEINGFLFYFIMPFYLLLFILGRMGKSTNNIIKFILPITIFTAKATPLKLMRVSRIAS